MQLLLFSAAGQRASVELDLVTEIVDRGVVVTLPHLPRAMAGVIPFRGVAVPLIDVGANGSLASAIEPATRGPRTIIVANDGARPVALLVDEVEGVVDAGECGGVVPFDLRGWLERIT